MIGLSSILKQKVFIYLLFFTFFSLLSYSVKSQVLSVRSSSTSVNSSFASLETDSIPILPSREIKNGGYNIDLTYQFSAWKNTYPFIRIGTFYLYNNQISIDIPENSFSKIENSLMQKSREFSITTGFLTEILKKNKFSLFGNLELAYSLTTSNYVDKKSEFYDLEGELDNTYLTNENRIKPWIIELGSGVRLEYSIINNFSFFIDATYKLHYKNSSGTSDITYEIINNEEEMIFENKVMTKEKNSNFSQRVPVSFGISWYLQNKKNNLKD